MKTTKLVAFGIISMTVLGLGAQGAQAAQVSHEGKSNGYVNLKDTWKETGIIDPPTTGPEVVVPPITSPIVGEKNLALIYYPDFYFTGEPTVDENKKDVVNFGDVTFNDKMDEEGKPVLDKDGNPVKVLGTVAPVDYDETNGTTLYAKPIPVTTPKEDEDGKIVQTPDGDRPLFVQVRSTVASWKLTAQATPFVSNIDIEKGIAEKDASKLNGAQIIITNITSQQNTDGVGKAADASALQEVTSGKDGSKMQGLDISNGEQEIGTMTGAPTTDVSRNSFMFGTEADAKGKAIGGYTANLIWTLSSDAI